MLQSNIWQQNDFPGASSYAAVLIHRRENEIVFAITPHIIRAQ
jgi:hypothetical protein